MLMARLYARHRILFDIAVSLILNIPTSKSQLPATGNFQNRRSGKIWNTVGPATAANDECSKRPQPTYYMYSIPCLNNTLINLVS